jgi:hypothetical protein
LSLIGKPWYYNEKINLSDPFTIMHQAANGTMIHNSLPENEK